MLWHISKTPRKTSIALFPSLSLKICLCRPVAPVSIRDTYGSYPKSVNNFFVRGRNLLYVTKSMSCLGTRLSFSYISWWFGQCIRIAAPPKILTGTFLPSASLMIRRISFSKSSHVANSTKQSHTCYFAGGLCFHIPHGEYVSNSFKSIHRLSFPLHQRIFLVLVTLSIFFTWQRVV